MKMTLKKVKIQKGNKIAAIKQNQTLFSRTTAIKNNKLTVNLQTNL